MGCVITTLTFYAMTGSISLISLQIFNYSFLVSSGVVVFVSLKEGHTAQVIYTKLHYEAVKDMFDKYCKVKKLKSPDSLLKIKAYKLIIMQKEAWDVIRGCNFDINSIRAISHQKICIHHKEDVSALVGNDEWKALGC